MTRLIARLTLSHADTARLFMSHADTVDRYRDRRLAAQIYAQLPDDRLEALAVLAFARELVEMNRDLEEELGTVLVAGERLRA